MRAVAVTGFGGPDPLHMQAYRILEAGGTRGRLVLAF